jgi:hypothetical protein
MARRIIKQVSRDGLKKNSRVPCLDVEDAAMISFFLVDMSFGHMPGFLLAQLQRALIGCPNGARDGSAEPCLLEII